MGINLISLFIAIFRAAVVIPTIASVVIGNKDGMSPAVVTFNNISWRIVVGVYLMTTSGQVERGYSFSQDVCK